MNRKRIGVIAVGLMMCAGAALWAQTKTEEAGGSLAALTAEVRQLRVAVEDGTRRQAEVQALAVSLSAQQSRMVQLNARIDAVRTEIAGAEQRAKQSAFFLGSAQKDAAAVDRSRRAQASDRDAGAVQTRSRRGGGGDGEPAPARVRPAGGATD